MRLSNWFVIDREKTFGELKFTAVRDVFLQNEDGTKIKKKNRKKALGIFVGAFVLSGVLMGVGFHWTHGVAMYENVILTLV